MLQHLAICELPDELHGYARALQHRSELDNRPPIAIIALLIKIFCCICETFLMSGTFLMSLVDRRLAEAQRKLLTDFFNLLHRARKFLDSHGHKSDP